METQHWESVLEKEGLGQPDSLSREQWAWKYIAPRFKDPDQAYYTVLNELPDQPVKSSHANAWRTWAAPIVYMPAEALSSNYPVILASELHRFLTGTQRRTLGGNRWTDLAALKVHLAAIRIIGEPARMAACKKRCRLLSPVGQEVHIYGLKEFCIANRLDYSHILDVSRGKRVHFMGWRSAEDVCRKCTICGGPVVSDTAKWCAPCGFRNRRPARHKRRFCPNLDTCPQHKKDSVC